MTRSKPITLLATVAIPLTALAVAGCGGGGNATASQAPAKAASGQATTVNVATSINTIRFAISASLHCRRELPPLRLR